MCEVPVYKQEKPFVTKPQKIIGNISQETSNLDKPKEKKCKV